MTKHVNMRQPEVVNRNARRGGSGLVTIGVIGIFAGIGWLVSGVAGVHPPPQFNSAAEQVRTQTSNVSRMGGDLYRGLFR